MPTIQMLVVRSLSSGRSRQRTRMGCSTFSEQTPSLSPCTKRRSLPGRCSQRAKTQEGRRSPGQVLVRAAGRILSPNAQNTAVASPCINGHGPVPVEKAAWSRVHSAPCQPRAPDSSRSGGWPTTTGRPLAKELGSAGFAGSRPPYHLSSQPPTFVPSVFPTSRPPDLPISRPSNLPPS